MKNLICTFFLIGLCIASAVGEPARMTIHRLQAGTPDSDGWYHAESTNGSFSVRLPIPFNDFTTPGSDDGTKLCYMIGSRSSEGLKFSATRTPILKPRKSINDFLSEFAAEYEKTGELKEKKFLTIDGHEALDCKVRDKSVTLLARVIGLPDGAFLMMVEYPNNLEESKVKGIADKFFTSAKISDFKPNKPAHDNP